MGTIRVHISTYEGNTSWEFPMKDSELDRKMKALGFGSSNQIPIAGVEWPEGLSMLNGLSVDADELNFLAKSMDRYIKSEMEQFLAAASINKSADLETLINLSFNVPKYTLVKNVSDMAKVGKDHYMNIHGSATMEELHTIDFAKIGRELLGSGRGVPTNYGLLFENLEVPFATVYDGSAFPPYYWRADFVMGVILEHNGKSELLCLPEEDITIDKALKRLGAPSLLDCTHKVDCYGCVDSCWQDRMENNLEYAGLNEANILAEVLARKDMDFGKLLWVTEYAEVVCGEDIQKLAKHLDDFIVIDDVENAMEVGEHFVLYDEMYKAAPEVLAFIDTQALGEYLIKERDGQFMGGCFVCMKQGCSFEQIMWRESPDMDLGGMQI